MAVIFAKWISTGTCHASIDDVNFLQ